MLFLYVPLVVVVLYAFNNSVGQKWPISSYTTKYFGLAWRNPLLRTALWNSVRIGLAATAIALVLGSLAAFAVHRFQFFGRNSVSFLLILPVA
ncbi:MAG: putative spermidine/putrescine transport system permease protein, partial [Actinomycetota bacterium]|nr:putative spermidine/putrescine transport system permease protein [Actinomycetota bacterium]